MTEKWDALELWLGMATHGLCDSAKIRVREEIAAHAKDAIEHEQRRGRNEADAVFTAVTDLGDPRRGRSAFRKVHMTEKELKRLRRIEHPPFGGDWTTLALLNGVILFGVSLTLTLELSTLRNQGFFLTELSYLILSLDLGMYLIPFILFYLLQKQTITKRYLYLVSNVVLSLQFYLSLLLLMLSNWIDIGQSRVFVLGVALLFVCGLPFIRRDFLILRKVRAEDRQRWKT